MRASIPLRAAIAHRIRRRGKQWKSNGRPRKHLPKSMTRDANPMALQGLRVTPDAELALRRKGQGALPPRRGKKIPRVEKSSGECRADSTLIKSIATGRARAGWTPGRPSLRHRCFSNSQKKSSAVLTASERRCFIVRASGDKYQTIAKPPIAPIVPTDSNVIVPH